MKRIFIITVLSAAVFFSRNAKAQEFNYGLQVGSNFAVQSNLGSIYNNHEIRTGLSAGVFGNYAIAEKFSLQAEFNYDQKGSKTDDFTKQYDYISIPVLAKYKLYNETGTKWKIDCYAGPYAAFLLNAEQKFESKEYKTIDLAYNTNNAEFGVQYGFMVKYPIRGHELLLNLKFGIGLTPFDMNNSDPKNKFAGIGLGYAF